MDFLNLTTWNIFLLFLFFPPGILLEITDRKLSTKFTKTTLQPDLKSFFTMETIRKMLTTQSPTPLTALTITTSIPTITKMLSSLDKTTKTITKTSQATTTTMRFSFTEQNTKNYTTEHEKQHNNYKESENNNKIREVENSHEVYMTNMTTTPKAIITTKHMAQHVQKGQHSKSIAVFATDFTTKTYEVKKHAEGEKVHNNTSAVEINDMTKPALEDFTKPALTDENKQPNLKLTNTQNPFEKEYTTNPFVNNGQQHTFERDEIANSSNINKIYINDSNAIIPNSINMLQHNNYNGSGQTTSTLRSAYKTNNTLNKSNQATALTSTTKKQLTFQTKENHMYDNNSALPYKSAALKASVPVIKTMSNILNVNRNSGSSSSSLSSRIGSSGSSFKRDTILSLAGILSTAKASVVDNIENSSIAFMPAYDDRKNALNRQHNFSSNISSEHDTLNVKEAGNKTTTATQQQPNKKSSSLPFNVPSADSVETIETTPKTKDLPKTETTSTTTTLKTTLKTTTRRRKISTTTLKPPPTIDDYQTVTSQAGTHAYLPCNVKQLVKKPISWLRVRDGHILTVDQTTFIADQRFQSVFTTNPERWSLQIKYVQLKDAGVYECQVSTEPKASAIVYLHIVEPKTELIGEPTRHVKAGSQVKLLCIISQALEPPLFINWFYNQKQIYLHNHKGWHTEIERIELPPDTTTSTTTTTTEIPIPKPRTTTTTTSSTSLPSSLTLTTTSSSMLNGSEVSAMHVFTSITPQQPLNDGNLLELVSEFTYNNYPNLIRPEAASISTLFKTEHTQTESTIKPETNITATATTATTGTTLPPALQETTTFDYTTDVNHDDYEEDYKIKPSAATFETVEAMAVERGYMMMSSLMTFTDVKQITTASLIIPSVQKQDSGNYTCSPSNSEPRTVILHVLNGEYSASAITSAALNLHIQFKFLTFYWSTVTLVNKFFKSLKLNKQHSIKQYSGG